MFDPTKPVQTRDGRKVRILCSDRKARSNIVALIGDEESIFACDSEHLDLINIPEKRKMTVWVNAYPKLGDTIYLTQRDADQSQRSDHSRLACIPVEIEYEV